MRRFFIILFYSFFLIVLGRNLLFIPEIRLGGGSTTKEPEVIRDDLINLLKKEKGNFNIYYEDLKTGETFSIYANTVTTAASMNKLPVVGYLYHLASKKEIDLQETIIIQESDIQDYGTGSIRYQKAGGQYTLQTLASLALQKSDNTAAHVLNIRLGEDNIQAYAYQIGMGSTSMVDNDSSARDIGKFFQMLYQGKIASKALTQELLGYMEHTDFEDRLPPLLPKNVHVYHKTGDGVNFVHDGGIIVDKKSPYILAVMTSNVTDEKKTKNAISRISKLVYDERGN